MNSLILGSGFGLYGYFPAIVEISKKVYLHDKYKKKFKNLKIYQKFENKVLWYKNLQNIIKDIDLLVIAKKPSLQFKFIKEIFRYKKKFKHLFLEKPIDINPKDSLKLIRYLEKNKISYSFGFIFKYCSWFKYLKNNNKKKEISIFWFIKKKNLSNSWKYKTKEGGGLIRFYGVHFLKLLTELKFNKVINNKISNNEWSISVKNKKNNIISITLKYNDKDKFLIFKNGKIFKNLDNPFLKKIRKYQHDPRVKYLKNYILDELSKVRKKRSIHYFEFLDFWKKVEKNISVKKI